MDPRLIEQLRQYRASLAAEVKEHGFMARSDRNKILARLLATDRLLSAEAEQPKEAA